MGNYESPALVKRFSRLFRSVSSRTRWNAVSATAADVIADCGLARRSDVQVVINIIDPADVAPTGQLFVHQDPNRLRIGYLQVAKWVKGFDILPKVIAEFSDVHDRIQFLIYGKTGSGPVWDELAAMPPGVVEMRPRTADVGDIYAECDIVFSPSRRESFNRVRWPKPRGPVPQSWRQTLYRSAMSSEMLASCSRLTMCLRLRVASGGWSGTRISETNWSRPQDSLKGMVAWAGG